MWGVIRLDDYVLTYRLHLCMGQVSYHQCKMLRQVHGREPKSLQILQRAIALGKLSKWFRTGFASLCQCYCIHILSPGHGRGLIKGREALPRRCLPRLSLFQLGAKLNNLGLDEFVKQQEAFFTSLHHCVLQNLRIKH